MITTGASFLDEALKGGYESGVVTTFYGPSGSGKTNLCLLAAVKVAEKGKRVIVVDTEGGMAVERIRQLSGEGVLDNFFFLKPTSFAEQKEVFEQLPGLINADVGMVIVDSISMLYRLRLQDNAQEVNGALGKQIATLVELARKLKLPVLVTNQVYADFENKDAVHMVGGDILRYGSKCLVELQRKDGVRKFCLRKHRFLAEGLVLPFEIVEEGVAKL